VKKRILPLVLVLVSFPACRKAPAAAQAAGQPAAQSSPVHAGGTPTGTQGAVPGTPAGAATPAQAKPVPAELPPVLARVNGEEIPRGDLELFQRNVELRQGPIPAERRDEILRAMLDRIITQRMLQQEANARHITATDAEVDEKIKEMRAPYPDEATFQRALDARKMSLERLKTDARNDIVVGKMLQEEVSTVPGASDAEAREFYEKNPDRFRQGESVRASHILIKVDETADAAAKKKARAQIDAVLKRAKAGEDFATLARENSADGSAQRGGDLGYITKGQTVPPFEQAAFALKPGEISDVVTTQFGYHIIKAADHKPPMTIPLEQVSDRVKQALTEQKKQEKAEQLVTALRQKSKIEVLI
jgi:peptidyl-prolyl cis-trans isomerase C